MCTLQPENGRDKGVFPGERIVSGSPADRGNLVIWENPEHLHPTGNDPLTEHLRTGLVPVETVHRNLWQPSTGITDSIASLG